MSPVRSAGPSRIPTATAADFDLITDSTVGTTRAVFPRPVLIETYGDEFKAPMTYNCNLTFEREVMTGLMARAGYVGSRNRNGRRDRNLNPSVYITGGHSRR